MYEVSQNFQNPMARFPLALTWRNLAELLILVLPGQHTLVLAIAPDEQRGFCRLIVCVHPLPIKGSGEKRGAGESSDPERDGQNKETATKRQKTTPRSGLAAGWD